MWNNGNPKDKEKQKRKEKDSPKSQVRTDRTDDAPQREILTQQSSRYWLVCHVICISYLWKCRLFVSLGVELTLWHLTWPFWSETPHWEYKQVTLAIKHMLADVRSAPNSAFFRIFGVKILGAESMWNGWGNNTTVCFTPRTFRVFFWVTPTRKRSESRANLA